MVNRNQSEFLVANSTNWSTETKKEVWKGVRLLPESTRRLG